MPARAVRWYALLSLGAWVVGLSPLTTRAACAQALRTPDGGGRTASLGQPRRFRWQAGLSAGAFFAHSPADLIVRAQGGVYHAPLNPVAKVAELGMEAYFGARGSRVDGGIRAVAEVPFFAARALFEKAAAQDHPGALERMGAFAQSGRGGPKDASAAKGYYDGADAYISYHPAIVNTAVWETHCGSYWSVLFTFECLDPETWTDQSLAPFAGSSHAVALPSTSSTRSPSQSKPLDSIASGRPGRTIST